MVDLVFLACWAAQWLCLADWLCFEELLEVGNKASTLGWVVK